MQRFLSVRFLQNFPGYPDLLSYEQLSEEKYLRHGNKRILHLMRKIVLFITGIFLSCSGFSQVTADVGIWGGGSGYIGDLEENTITQISVPFLGAFFRYNFNQRVGARLQIMTGPTGARGPIQNYDWTFNKSISELTLQAEINYLKYMLGNKKASFSPFVTAGLGIMYFNYDRRPGEISMFNQQHILGPAEGNEAVVSTVLPFGIGFKFNLAKRLGVGIEYQMRMIFDDRLDDLDDPLAHRNQDGNIVKYSDFIHNNDWTGYLGLFLTYKIYTSSKPCPAFDSIK